jgi:hypothetical protein
VGDAGAGVGVTTGEGVGLGSESPPHEAAKINRKATTILIIVALPLTTLLFTL